MNSMKRMALAALAVIAFGLPARVVAQDSPQQQAYKSKRAQLLKELEESQKDLADIKGQRVQLQARIESVIANMMQQRAQALLMSNEQTALQQLDAILTSSQDNLLAQRDRFLALGDAVRRRTGSVIVVVLRADSTAPQTLQTATLSVNASTPIVRTYSADANNALQIGAVDELYRANVLPTSHTLSVQISVNGQTLSQSVTVSSAAETVTYVQFTVRNGQLTHTTWTSRGTTPF